MLAIPHLSQVSSMAEIDSKEAQKKLKAGIGFRITSHNKHTWFLLSQKKHKLQVQEMKTSAIYKSLLTTHGLRARVLLTYAPTATVRSKGGSQQSSFILLLLICISCTIEGDASVGESLAGGVRERVARATGHSDSRGRDIWIIHDGIAARTMAAVRLYSASNGSALDTLTQTV
ncbi:hypothetical protein Tco_0717697 [Tanacetum coccineum]